MRNPSVKNLILVNGHTLDLTRHGTAKAIISLFISAPNNFLTKDQITSTMWGLDKDSSQQRKVCIQSCFTQTIVRLREKLKETEIVTEWIVFDRKKKGYHLYKSNNGRIITFDIYNVRRLAEKQS